MSSPQTGSVTLASSGTSSIIQLDPLARVTSYQIVGSSGITSTSTQSVTADITVQVTFNTWSPGGSSQIWGNLSSVHYTMGTGAKEASSGDLIAVTADGILGKISGPVAGLRLSSTTWAPTIVKGTLYLKVLQSITAGP